jgi:hypothetical protein
MIAEPYILHWRDSFPWAKMQNVEAKLNDEAYRNGMATLLRPGTPFDPDEAWANVRKHIVDRLMTPRDLREMKKGVKVPEPSV